MKKEETSRCWQMLAKSDADVVERRGKQRKAEPLMSLLLMGSCIRHFRAFLE
jgi:hypothetical protein